MFLKALVIDPMFPRQLFLGFWHLRRQYHRCRSVRLSVYDRRISTADGMEPHTGTGQNL